MSVKYFNIMKCERETSLNDEGSLFRQVIISCISQDLASAF